MTCRRTGSEGNSVLLLVGKKDSPDYSYSIAHNKVMHTWLEFELQKTEWNQCFLKWFTFISWSWWYFRTLLLLFLTRCSSSHPLNSVPSIHLPITFLSVRIFLHISFFTYFSCWSYNISILILLSWITIIGIP